MSMFILLMVLLIVEHVAIIWWIHKTNREVQTLHWRLDGIWKKATRWHGRMDKITGEVRRMTGDFEAQELEDAEEFDDVDRSADTQPGLKKKRPRRRK